VLLLGLTLVSSAHAVAQTERLETGYAYQYLTSHVRIISVMILPLFSNQIGGTEIYHRGCVAFSNEGSVPIANVTFTFWPKRFPDDAKAAYSSATGLQASREVSSHEWACALTTGTSAFVSSVRYADGSLWAAPPNAPGGLQAERTAAAAPPHLP